MSRMHELRRKQSEEQEKKGGARRQLTIEPSLPPPSACPSAQCGGSAAAAAAGVGVGVGCACCRKGLGTAVRWAERRPALRFEFLLPLPLVLRLDPTAEARAAFRAALACAVFAFALSNFADTLLLTRSMSPDSQARSRLGK